MASSSVGRRGEVVWVGASRSASGREQRGRRPAVVLQSDSAAWLGTVVVAPTSTSAQQAEFRPRVRVGGKTICVLLDQLKSVDRSRVRGSVGHLAAADLGEVEESLALFLGLL